MSDIERRDGQGEDERALMEAVRKIRKVGAIFMDEGGRPSVGFLLTEGQAVKELAALRSRLAEPVITREEIEGMPLVNTLPYPKPAMSEEDERLPTARDAKELVEHIMATWGEQQYDVINEIDRYVAMRIRAALSSERERYARQFADMSANEVKLSAALASERAKVCAACGDPLGEVAYCDVCAEEVRNPALLAKRFPDAYTPDAAALRAEADLYRRQYDELVDWWRGERPAEEYNGNAIEERHARERAALLRSEPRGEEAKHE